jgi:hypothetical protein
MRVLNAVGFEELHNVCSSPIIIVIKSKEDEMGGA